MTHIDTTHTHTQIKRSNNAPFNCLWAHLCEEIIYSDNSKIVMYINDKVACFDTINSKILVFFLFDDKNQQQYHTIEQ